MAGFVIRGMFPAPKPDPKPALPPWIGFQVEGSAAIDLDAAEVRGFQGLIKSVPSDPSQPSEQYHSELFVVKLTTAPDALNPHPLGDVGAIRGILDARVAALGAEPKRTFTVSLAGSGIGVSFAPFSFDPSLTDIQQIMGIVLMRSKQQDTMGVYDDPAWPVGSSIVMTVNGVPV